VIGAVAVNYAKTYFTGAFAELWLFMLGGLFVLTTLYLPKGIVGWVKQMQEGDGKAAQWIALLTNKFSNKGA
jgi:urea transport system permease protein